MLLILASLMFTGCTSEMVGEKSEPAYEAPSTPQESKSQDTGRNAGDLKVYYFYHPRCPNCQAVEPPIDYLLNNTEINFEMCNVQHFNYCSGMSRQLAYSLKEKTGFFGTPTAIIQENGKFTVFIGKYQMVDMVGYLRNYTYIPEIPLKDTQMNVEECFECHEKRDLEPPSTMTCSYCCHGAV